MKLPVTLHDLLSKEMLQATLEECDWTTHDSEGVASQYWKLPKDDILLCNILHFLPYRIGQLGDYFYTKDGNFIKRTSHLIVSKTFKNEKFHFVKGES